MIFVQEVRMSCKLWHKNLIDSVKPYICILTDRLHWYILLSYANKANGLNLFILHRLWNKFSELILSCSLPGWTSTRAHCVVCERHEVQCRCRRDLNPRPSDPWSDTLPLDQLSSTEVEDVWLTKMNVGKILNPEFTYKSNKC